MQLPPFLRWLSSSQSQSPPTQQLQEQVDPTALPYLFPDPSAEDFLRYIFKIVMTKYPGGFKPTSLAAIVHILTNPIYIGCWVYKDAIVCWDNHPAIVDKDLFLWVYQRITGHDLEGNPIEGQERQA